MDRRDLSNSFRPSNNHSSGSFVEKSFERTAAPSPRCVALLHARKGVSCEKLRLEVYLFRLSCFLSYFFLSLCLAAASFTQSLQPQLWQCQCRQQQNAGRSGQEHYQAQDWHLSSRREWDRIHHQRDLLPGQPSSWAKCVLQRDICPNLGRVAKRTCLAGHPELVEGAQNRARDLDAGHVRFRRQRQ